MRNQLWAEFLGTFALVFFGTGAVIVNEVTHGILSLLGVTMTFGVTVMVLIYTFGDISGAHFNPSVTLAFALAKRFEAQRILPFVAAQLAGGATASLVLRALFPQPSSLGVTEPSGSVLQSLLLEMILTWFLMLVILNVSVGSKQKGITAGLVIGGVIVLEATFAGPICGASMNLARSFGPALVTMNWKSLWIYVLGPTIGAVLAVPTMGLLRTPEGTMSEDEEMVAQSA